MQVIPIGMVVDSNEIDVSEFDNVFSSFLETSYYESIDDCLNNLKNYNVYVCIDVIFDKAIHLDVYYDNTRENIIWGIIGRIKDSVDLIQKRKSKEIASDFLSDFNSNMNKLSTFKTNLNNVNRNIDSYIQRIDVSINELNDAENELRKTLNQMDRDIAEINLIKNSIRSTKDSNLNSMHFYLNSIENNHDSIQNISNENFGFYSGILHNTNNLRNQLNNYNSQFNTQFNNFDNKISDYESASLRGRQYVSSIDSSISYLRTTRSNLLGYKSDIQNINSEISSVESDFNKLRGLNPEILVNPVVISNYPAYTPSFENDFFSDPDSDPDSESDTNLVDEAIKGLNMISLQTLYPTILFLITLFLSLLISSFITLRQINSLANTRIKILRKIFFPSYVSSFVSAHIILIIPLTAILVLGRVLFKIPIFQNFYFIVIAIFLLSSTYILLGMSLAYLIKKESITLLVSTFILVFLIFFSGFLLPIERMTNISSMIARIFPGNMILYAFNKFVFYSQPISSVFYELKILLLWFVVLIFISLIIKKMRKV
jgi:hypothetical protein